MDEALIGPPEKVSIPHPGPVDYVGRLNDGTQFMAFVTGAVPDGYVFNTDNEDWRKVKRWVGVLHLFDAEGNHLRSEAKLGAYDVEGRGQAGDKAWAEVDKMLDPLRARDPELRDIRVKPFAVVLDDITHGLIYETFQPEENGPVFECVMLEPRDLMFHPPWDSGSWSS